MENVAGGDDNDEFGDLYADVEVQASSAINAIAIHSSSVEFDATGNSNYENVVQECESESESESESEDDLNIVLNDDENDDCEDENEENGGFSGEGNGLGQNSNGSENGNGEKNSYKRERGDDSNIVSNDDEDGDSFLNGGFGEDENEEIGGFSGEGNGLGQNANGSENGNGERNSYKYTRPPQAAYSSHLKANGSSSAPSYSTASVKGNWEDNSYAQRVGSGFAAQNGQSFSLPWSRNSSTFQTYLRKLCTFGTTGSTSPGAYLPFGDNVGHLIKELLRNRFIRNILDMNIDMFEKKPWRYPGVDLTDYFNFGFDQDSWKQYCNCLDEHREQAKKVVKDSNYNTSRKSKPKGREIKVEESMIERLPSTDVGRPQDRDSGVVIQIALQQSMEDPISSTKEQQEASKNEDVGGDRKEFLCFSSASEDELASLEGTGEGSGNSTSGRHTTPVREHVSMDSDNDGNSEFSDADERHHQEGTYCNVDQTSGAIKSSHDANKSSERDISDPRKPIKLVTFISKKRKPIKLHAPLHGGGREHSPGSSCCSPSHGGTFGDGAFLDLEKSHDHHTRLLSNAESKFWEKGTIDYQPISRTKYVRTKSGDPKYFARDRRSVQRDLLHDRRRPGRMSETISAHLKDEDSCKSDARILYERRNSTVIQHRQKDRRYAFDAHEREDTSHFKRVERFDSNAGQFSDYPCRVSYTKNPEIECQLKCRYDKSWSGGGRVKTKLDPLELSIYTDDELLETERPHFGRRLTVQDMDNVSFYESEKWIDKYIPYLDDEKSSQRMRKIDQLQSNKRVRSDVLVTECNYIYDVMEETDNRYRPYNSRDTNILEDGYHVNSTYFKRTHNNSPCKSSDDVCCMDLNDKEGRFDGYRCQSFRLFRESCTASRRGQNPELPRGRHRIFSGTRICDGQFANLTNSIGANQAIKYPGNHDNFKRRRGGRQSERMQWLEDEVSSRCQQNILDAERTSYSFRRTSSDRRFQSFDNKHGTNPVEKLLDDRHVDQEKYKLIREGNIASQFGQGPKVFHKDNHWRRFPRGRDSVDTGLVVEDRESSRRCSKAGGVTYFDRYGYLDSDSYVELKSIDGTSKPHFRKTLRTRNVTTDPKENDKERLDIFSDAEQEVSLDIEEGQIISEEMNEKIVKKRITCSGKSKISEMKDFANDKKLEEQDNARILEIMAKMEKRRERFKQPIALKSDPKNVSKPLVDSFAVLTEAMQPRPARKRRWAASEAI